MDKDEFGTHKVKFFRSPKTGSKARHGKIYIFTGGILNARSSRGEGVKQKEQALRYRRR